MSEVKRQQLSPSLRSLPVSAETGLPCACFGLFLHGSSRPCRAGAIQNAVEEKLESRMRLRTLQDFRPEEKHTALAERRLRRNHAVLEVLLAPGPTALQRRLRIEPRDSGDAGTRAKNRAVVEEHTGMLGHTECDWIAGVH